MSATYPAARHRHRPRAKLLHPLVAIAFALTSGSSQQQRHRGGLRPAPAEQMKSSTWKYGSACLHGFVALPGVRRERTSRRPIEEAGVGVIERYGAAFASAGARHRATSSISKYMAGELALKINRRPIEKKIFMRAVPAAKSPPVEIAIARYT